MTDDIRRYIYLIESASTLRDKAFDRFWWVDNEFIMLDDQAHADYVMEYYESMSTGDEDDDIYYLGDTAEEVNRYFIMHKNAVRGGIMSSPDGSIVYLDGKTIRNVHLCLRELVKEHLLISSVTIQAGKHDFELFGNHLEFFITKGKVPRVIP
jgi:hypothetical protein